MGACVQDTFAGRTVGNGTSWGTASDGHTWNRTSANNNTVLSVSSSEGRSNSGNTYNFMILGSGTATDQEALFRWTPGNVNDIIGSLIRSDSTGANSYACNVGRFTNDIEIGKWVAGSFTSLNIWVTGLTITVGTFYWIRFNATGTTLSCKIWTDGSSEPAGWTGQVTDSAIASGWGGLYFNMFSTTNAQFDTFSLTSASCGAAKFRLMDGYGGVFS